MSIITILIFIKVLFQNISFVLSFIQAQNITWGKNMGCDFAMKSCKELMEKDGRMKKALSLETYNLQKSPFCQSLQDGGGLTLCNHDRSSVGSCNLVQYERSLPRIYQNFEYVENVKRKDIRKVELYTIDVTYLY